MGAVPLPERRGCCVATDGATGFAGNSLRYEAWSKVVERDADSITDLPTPWSEGRGKVWPETIVQTCLLHLVPKYLSAGFQARLGRVEACDPDLHRGQCRRGSGGVRRIGRTVGAAHPGDHPVMGQRVGHLDPVRRLRSLSQNLMLVGGAVSFTPPR